MGRLKKEHGGYRTSGLWLKYKSPAVSEKPRKPKSKKDKRKWCRGKQGVEHELRRYFYTYGWESKRSNWIRTRCIRCGKQFHQNNSSIPLEIPIDEVPQVMPIQVKVNGVCLPIDPCWYRKEYCWCGEFH